MRNTKEITKEEALSRLQTLCARAEKCTSDVRKKMLQWKLDEADSNWVLSQLIEDKYVDDARYALAYTREKAQFSRWGENKIKLNLRAKGIDKQYIEEALTQIQPEQNQGNLHNLLQQKAKQVSAKSEYDRRNKLIRFALARGFSLQMIVDELDSIVGEVEPD